MLRFVLFLFLGIPILLLGFLSDIVAFLAHCYQDDMRYRKMITKCSTIEHPHFLMLEKKFQTYLTSGVKFVEFEKIAVDIRDELKVFEHISFMIYSNPNVTNEQCTQVIDNYVQLKKILKACCVTNGPKPAIPCRNMLNVLRDMKKTASMRMIFKTYINSNSSKKQIKGKMNVNIDINDNSYINQLYYFNLCEVDNSITECQPEETGYAAMKKAMLNVLLENREILSSQFDSSFATVAK